MLILTFHAIDNRGDVLAYDPAEFARLMKMLHEHGYQSSHLGEHSERSVAITFDDAYQSVYDAALPVMQEYGMHGTVFVTGLKAMEGRMTLDWNAIRNLDAAGWEIGAHTCTHPDLTGITPEKAEREIRESKAMIEQQIGKAVTRFAYPFGRYNRVVSTITAAHFEIAVSDRLSLLSAGDDLYSLPRLDSYYFRGDAMRWLVSPRLNWYVKGRALPRNLRRFITTRRV